jgi:hypothetical protein
LTQIPPPVDDQAVSRQSVLNLTEKVGELKLAYLEKIRELEVSQHQVEILKESYEKRI